MKDGKEYYIQVAYSVKDDKAYNRELEAFVNNVNKVNLIDFKKQSFNLKKNII